jgi:uncharacterized protein YneF (UPF0154 family)
MQENRAFILDDIRLISVIVVFSVMVGFIGGYFAAYKNHGKPAIQYQKQ